MNFLLMASFAEVMNYVLYVLIAVLVLLVMITVHELGHYLTGKIFDFAIEEFAIGFGPKIFKKTKKNGEVFSVRVFPLGGFCSFRGEDKEDGDPRAFNNKKPWQRIIVLVSGALMNYIFAVFIICLMFGIYGTSALMTYEVSGENPSGIILTDENSFKNRDVILKANGKDVYIITDLMNAVNGKQLGDTVDFTVIRNGEKRDMSIVMLADADLKNVEDVNGLCNVLGIKVEKDEEDNVVSNGFRSTGVRRGFFTTIGCSFNYSFKLAGTIFTVIGQLFRGEIGIKSLGGTVTTISVTAGVIKNGGWWSLLNIASFIGVNLAVFNLLPIPALDGSKAVFTTIEWIRGKPINRRVEGIIHAVGFLVIILFAIFIDLQQCF